MLEFISPASATTVSTIIRYMTTDSSIGKLGIAANDNAIVELLMLDGTGKAKTTANNNWEPVADVGLDVANQLADYFAGTRQQFSLKLAPQGTTFQCEVWQALTKIPLGETRSYQHIAEQINRPKAMRAVGAANGRNPIPVIVPCHRVIGANGALTGFGGGLPIKQWLLEHENQ